VASFRGARCRRRDDIQRKTASAAITTVATAAAGLKSRGFNADGIGKESDPESIIVAHAKRWSAA